MARISLLLTCLALACAVEDSGEASGDAELGSLAGSAEVDAAGTESESSSSSEAESESETEDSGALGEEYGPCVSVGDCPPGMGYVCLQKVTEGAVCAPGCAQDGLCPEPPPGGSVDPVCTTVDGDQRCVLALCESDEDCPTGMSCHIEAYNWCHWPV